MRVNEIIAILNNFAPETLAYDWDNPGLQVGDYYKDVQKPLLSLDVTPTVLDYAQKNGCDMIISHHPLIFKALKKITDPLLLGLVKCEIPVYSAHTNLDKAKNGVNKALATALQLQNLHFIERDTDTYLISVLTPPESKDSIMEKAAEAGAGIIGNYRECHNFYEVRGSYIPQKESNPYLGNAGTRETVSELKLEFLTDSHRLNKVISSVLRVHPYEEPVYTVQPLKNKSANSGMGYEGELITPSSLDDFAQFVKSVLRCPYVDVWCGEKIKPIKKVAVCGGSGSMYINKVKFEVDAMVTGDVTYHAYLDSPLAVINAGHFYTEYPVLQVLQNLLAAHDLTSVILPFEMAEIHRLKRI